MYLARNGHRVRPFTGEEDPRLLLTRAPADLILLDLDLGQVNGADLLRQLRQLPAPYNRTPILILTGTSAAHVERLNLAADGYIQKMNTADEVLHQINQFLARHGQCSQPKVAATSDQAMAADSPWGEADWSAESLHATRGEHNHRAFITLDHQVLDLLGADIGMDVLRQIMVIFVEDLVTRSQQVSYALLSNDHRGIRHQAHALKSSAATYGATQLTVLCSNIDNAHHNEQLERLCELAQALEEVARQTTQAVQHYLANRAG